MSTRLVSRFISFSILLAFTLENLAPSNSFAMEDEIVASGAKSFELNESRPLDVIVVMSQPAESVLTLQQVNGLREELVMEQRNNWETVHKFFNIISDLNGISGATLLVVAVATHQPKLFPIGTSELSATFFLELFRNLDKKIQGIKANPVDTRSVCTYVDLAASLGSLVGLCMISSGTAIETGAWLLGAGGIARYGAFSTLLGTYGIRGTFGNDHDVTNSIFKIGCGALGVVGGTLLAVSATNQDPTYMSAGVYLLGLSGILSTGEVLVSDCQAF